jgi:molybdate transport system substrate-binding protein
MTTVEPGSAPATIAGFRKMLCVLPLLLLGCAEQNDGDSATVAVASNFLVPATLLAGNFAERGLGELTVVSGSTGQLYAQIINGAPFDILLAADQERPRLLGERGQAIPGSQFSYAIGRLLLCSSDAAGRVDDGIAVLRNANFRHLAIANPALAPYGLAAMETLESLGVRERLADRLVVAENISQVYTLLVTANVEFGLVARSSVMLDKSRNSERCWPVPAALHSDIRQDAILTKRAQANPVAAAFMVFLASADAKSLIRSYGYDTDT